MPSPNPRIQVCAEPAQYAQIKTLAKGRNMTMSAVVQELCALALSTDEIREEYEQAANTYGEVPVKKDNRSKPRQRPHYKSYEEVAGKGTMLPSGLTTTEMDVLVEAKRKGRLSDEQSLKAVDVALSMPANKDEEDEKQRKKKELLVSVLKEIMDS